jgi:hypothetical protein
MTYFYYKTNSWSSQPQPQISEDQVDLWKHLAEKKNWRIVQLPNGFYQTEHLDKCDCSCCKDGDSCENGESCKCKWLDVTRRETLEGAESAIDGSVEHYAKKIEFLKGPKVVKTFK